LKNGFCSVYDADLKGYFDGIPHDKLLACVRMRVVDGSVLKLIRMWLQAPIKETPKDGGKPTVKRNRKGRPQGGVISPLLANIYLHWFDKVFHRSDGPVKWANAKLVRYADDFVVLARHISPELQQFVETKIEDWLGLEINREKTKVYNARARGQTLDFLGYSFHYDRDLHGRPSRYWNQFPSSPSVQRERAKLKELTSPRSCFKPLREVIKEVNTQLQGWANYYGKGYPRKAFRGLNRYVRLRLTTHAKRRSQRGYRCPQGKSFYSHFADIGLCYL
jgi:RNA-directed DNA polymerase